MVHRRAQREKHTCVHRIPVSDMTKSRAKLWWLAVRPKTLPAAIAPVLIGAAMAQTDGATVFLPALAALFGAVMIQIGTNLANDYYDFVKGADAGVRLGPTRLTQAGLITPSAMKQAAMIAFGLALLIGCYLVWRGGWPIVIIGLLSILFGVLYTGGPYPLGYHGLGEIFVLIFFGPVAVGGTYYVQMLDINAVVVVAGLAPGLFSVAILTINNLRDIDSDRQAGKRTLAVRLGRRFARCEYIVAVLAACAVPTALYVWRGDHPFSLLATVTALAAIGAFRTALASTDGTALNGVLATTGKLLLLYCVLFSIGWAL